MTPAVFTSIENILDWAEARNLIKGSNPIAQLAKTIEECGEILTELQAREIYDPEDHEHSLLKAIEVYKEFDRKLKLEYGDALVTLIIGMAQNNYSVAECLSLAYDKIKDRKGRMINGQFVKEGDL